MTGPEVNAILIRLATFEATVVGRLDTLAADNVRGEGVHQDHESRLRQLEASANEGRGVWKLFTAGGVLGASLVGAGALAARSLGL